MFSTDFFWHIYNNIQRLTYGKYFVIQAIYIYRYWNIDVCAEKLWVQFQTTVE